MKIREKVQIWLLREIHNQIQLLLKPISNKNPENIDPNLNQLTCRKTISPRDDPNGVKLHGLTDKQGKLELNQRAAETPMAEINVASGTKRALNCDGKDSIPVQKKHCSNANSNGEENDNQCASSSGQKKNSNTIHDTDFAFTLNHPFVINVT